MPDTDLIAIDWGTTNRRVFVIGEAGTILAYASDGVGVLSVPKGGFPAEIARLRSRFGDRPMLLAGMVGSDRGWMGTPYLPCPVKLDDLAANLCPADRLAKIVPGVSDTGHPRHDVMRGEEVQLLGAIATGLVSQDAPACHPGTHAKWVKLRSGCIEAFRTVMTGELFALLGKHSILAEALRAPVTPGDAFLEGVNRALGLCELPADLFSIRARILLGALSERDAASYASGLLIGSDIRIGLAFVEPDEPVALIGNPRLTALYARALVEAGRSYSEVDGERAFVAGMKALAEKMP